MSRLVRIWDLPTRIFHWTLVACVIGLVLSAEFDFMDWHFRLGYTVLALLLFRLVWGVAGGHWSRFSSFLYSPTTVRRYLRGQGEPAHSAGHSPTGALSVYALLLFLGVQVASGLFSDDEDGRQRSIDGLGQLHASSARPPGITARWARSSSSCWWPCMWLPSSTTSGAKART